MIINKIIYHFVPLADSTALCTWHCFRSSATQNCYRHWFPVCSATWCTVGRWERRDSGTIWSICGLLVFPVKHIELSHSKSSTALGACEFDLFGRTIHQFIHWYKITSKLMSMTSLFYSCTPNHKVDLCHYSIQQTYGIDNISSSI